MAAPPGRRSRLIVAGLLAALAVGTLVAVSIRADAVVPAPAGWNLMFSDDFTGPANQGVDTTNWRYTTGTSYPGGPGNFGTGEVETMTSSPDNVSLDGAGNLRITPIRDSAGNWTSGRIETNRADFEPPATGRLRIEARMQLPNVTGAEARGYWPAFWILGAGYRGNLWNWPMVGEVDIMENVQGLNNEVATFHCGTSPGGPCGEKDGIGGSRPCAPTTCQEAMHTYTLEWDRGVTPQQLRWYLDGVQFHSVSANQVDPGTWAAATGHGFFAILDVAMGGEFPAKLGGGPDVNTVSGRPLTVDYVAVWSSASTAGPAPTPVPTGGPVVAPTPIVCPTVGPGPTGAPTPLPPGGVRDAFRAIQAESYDEQSGTALENTTDTDAGTDAGGQDVTAIGNGDWARYQNVDFASGPATQLLGRVASGAAGGVGGLVEVRLDNLTSAPIGSFALANTGGWQSWRTIPANIAPVTGTHNVYLTFTSGQPSDYVNVNWFAFAP